MSGPLQVTAEVVTTLVPVLMAALVATMLYVMEPPVTRGVVLSLTPWMVVGGAVHTLYTAGAYPADFSLRPFFGPVTVYFSTFVAAGIVWAMMSTASELADSTARDAQYLAAAGVGAALTALLIVLSRAGDTEALVPAFAGLVVAVVVAAVVYLAVTLVHTKTLVQTGLLGLVGVFAHALDGVIAAVGVDVLGQGAGYAAGQWLLARTATLPTADLVGRAWVLVALKLVLAVVVVVTVATALDRPAGRDRPWVGYVALGLFAAYGLGPGVHRFLSLVVG
jgi:uncharacterized membrane protein